MHTEANAGLVSKRIMSSPSVTSYHMHEYHNYGPLSRHRIVISVSCILLLLALVPLVHLSYPLLYANHAHIPKYMFATSFNIVSSVCRATVYPGTCMRTLSSSLSSQNVSLLQLVLLGSKAADTKVGQALNLAKELSILEHGNVLEIAALQDCLQLLDEAKYHLNNTIFQLSNHQNFTWQPITAKQITNMMIWVSTALTYQDTCTDGLDGLSNQKGNITNQMDVKQEEVSQVITNALSLLSQLGNGLSKERNSSHYRRLLSIDLPEWLSASDRKLLQAPPPSSSSVWYNAVVATDGSAQYTMIQNAVDDIPSNYTGRYVIYIKKGTYNEIVAISKDFQNITFLGDGISETIITGNRSVASGLYTTFDTATVGISGQGFIARDITFQNTAGASGRQAVALRAGADYLLFDRCSFDGYQDTLYALSSRQFYRDCKIYGTVDMIFGNAAAVFKNCKVLARQPMKGQKNTITAQGRRANEEPTGFSFQNCTVAANEDLQGSNYTVMTFLGRPWKPYSRTVFLKSFLDNLIQPAGWLAWNSSDPFENTVYFGEYENDGPGAGTSKRASWIGIHPNLSYDEASMFSLESFISGTAWVSDVDAMLG